MSNNRIFLAATGQSLARAQMVDSGWRISKTFEGLKINCIEPSTQEPGVVYLGTQHEGVFASHDAGRTWWRAGLQGIPVKCLAIDSHNPEIVYAGGKPVSLYQSLDGGETWRELEAMRRTRRWWWFSPADPPGITPYVSGLALSTEDPDVILAGIELGAVMRSEDGGRSWSGHLRGSYRDCHSLKFHFTNANWVYEGGGGGVSFSKDGGRTWLRDKNGLGAKYGWWVAADPEEEDIWYLSASDMPNLLRGEFIPPAHQDGTARAHIYRKKGYEPWEQLGGGLPDPLDYMAYSLVTVPNEPGIVYAGMANGEIWQSTNYGNNWEKLNLRFEGIHTAMCVVY